MNVYFRFFITRVLIFLLLIISHASHSTSAPWRLSGQLGFPSWLSLDFEHRTRYETLDGQYRSRMNGNEGKGGDQALVFRTLAHAKVDLQSIRFGAELMDSRIALADAGSASDSKGLTTTIANPIELLQAYVELPFNNLLLDGSQALIRAGRITIDMGSRRLIARNRYRNTINAFNGIDVQWQHQAQQVRAFYTLPIQRRVKGDIVDNRARLDAEHPEVRFWGLYYKQAIFSEQDLTEFFLLGLDEDDTQGRPTNNRKLYTFGTRLWRNPTINSFDYQLETVFQTGNSRTSKASPETLRHNAHFHHIELGYSFDLPWSPRVLVQYDYASGDDNPNDNHNNRFDTLYGARRFDFGPTSIYGAFARSNINSPGIRITLKPHAKVSSMFALRGFWRASTTDTWTTAGINGSDPYIGTQLECRLRWDFLPGNVRLETGFVHLFSGDLMEEANRDNATYGYFLAAVRF
jgi:hypothetical protein